MTDDLLTRLKFELAPTEDALDRERTRLSSEIERGGADAAETRASSRRPSRPYIRAGVAMVGAVAAVLVVALSPFDSSTDRRGVPAPATAQAALKQAAGSAGSADWTPLGAGEYHHTMTTTFTPDIPERPGDPRAKIEQMFTMSGPASQEAWIDRAGTGLTIDVMGGNGDPDLYPDVQPDGYGSQPTFGRKYPERDVVEVDVSLRLADQVRVTKSLPDERAVDSIWYRTPKGFERRAHRTGPAMTDFPDGFAAFIQTAHWEATIEQIDAVNDADDSERAAAIETLLGAEATGFFNAGSFGRPGQYGVTSESQEEDRHIVGAIELLGSAPISPSVRQDLFEWLSKRPTATLEGDDTDELGRHGTRVTFERIYDETVPSELVTIDELRDEVERTTGTRPDGDVRGPRAIQVKEDQQYRRFYVSILFDPKAGELLEHVMYARTETTAQRPRLQRNTIRGDGPQPPWRVAMGVDRQGLSDATLYGVRERTSGFTNVQSTACATTPAMCR